MYNTTFICDQETDCILDLNGKIAVISGGSSGIGFGTAKLLSLKGAVSVILDIDEKRGKKAVLDITALGGKAEFVACDVTRDSDCRLAIESIADTHGTIDILFNNAGVIRRKTVENLEENEWDMVVDVTLKGAYLLSKYTVPVMAKTGGGSIINTGSGWGLKGGEKAVAYCAAKGGIVNMTRAMAIDHGPQGIRVNSVSPGDIDTPLLHDEAKQLGQDDESFMEEAADRPLRRVGTPKDIALAVLFFASPMSNWVTGTNLTVDGGGLA
ncbi:MAG: SDR family oxidoreductase [Desulfobacula sp.]|nr:SDR family oxidoreductase [Desulfobacula sp.]